jgi:hypothetical protein
MTAWLWRRAPLLLLLMAVAPMIGGCVSSPDAKQASTEMMGALDELDGASREFQSLYKAEVETTRREIGEAIVARAVFLKVADLSNGFKDRGEQFKSKGLIELSRDIEKEQTRARKLVEEVSKLRLAAEQDAQTAVKDLVSRQPAALRKSAQALEATSPGEAEKLRERADALDAGVTLSEDKISQAYFKSLVELSAIESEVPQNMQRFRDVIAMLRETHAVVHGWVMTDVTVSGKELGALVEKHAKEFGFAEPAATTKESTPSKPKPTKPNGGGQ